MWGGVASGDHLALEKNAAVWEEDLELSVLSSHPRVGLLQFILLQQEPAWDGTLDLLYCHPVWEEGRTG